MKRNAYPTLGILGFFLTFVTLVACAQEKASPATTAEGTINGAEITINYSSPAVKGRTIWGELVPFNQVWRAGANEATIFETSQDIKVQGETLPAGKYSFYIIPGEQESIFIFNGQTGQWGTQYDESQDVLRVSVRSEEVPEMAERLKYEVEKDGFSVQWEHGYGKAMIE